MEVYSEAIQAREEITRRREADAAAAQDAKHFADELKYCA
jgi:hypothetical protein